MREDRNFNGGMRDKHTSAGAKFAHFDKRDAGWKTENFACYAENYVWDGGIELEIVAGYGFAGKSPR